MSKCGKVKNPCKYCLEQVTNKTGLRCEGACKKWAHFKCLHYTPGKISDIKAGIIKVMCPCPDCETTQIKEYIVNPPFTCSNHKCPANSPGLPKCDSAECPANAKCPSRPPCPPKPCSPPPCPPRVPCPPKPPCSPPPCPPRPPCPPKPPCSPPPCPPKPCPPKPCPPKPCSPPPCPPKTVCLPPPCPSPPCRSPPPCPSPPPCTMPNRRPAPLIPSSSSSVDSCTNPKCSSSSSIQKNCPRPSPGQASMAITLKEMCGTVGTLSQQLKELMCKINEM